MEAVALCCGQYSLMFFGAQYHNINMLKYLALILILTCTAEAQQVEKLIYADAGCNGQLVAIWNYETIDGCSVEQCKQIGLTGFHAKISCQANRTVAPNNMNEYIEYETDCMTQTTERTAAVPDMCIPIDSTISIKFSTCDLTDSQFSFTYWSDVSNCSDPNYQVFVALPVCDLRSGRYVGAVCNVLESTPSTVPISEPTGSVPIKAPYVAPVHVTPIKPISSPPNTSNALATAINFVLLCSIALFL